MSIASHVKKGLVSHEHEILGDIPCKNPERHKGYQRESGCWYCRKKWRESLPWHRLNNYTYAPDEVREDIRSKDRFSNTIRDRLAEEKGNWSGFACEMFGVVIGESEKPDE
jgi:hypothetical protein